MEVLGALPGKLTTMFNSVSTLPPLDPSTMPSISQMQLADPGKRQWETSKTGYLNWAVGQLLERTKEEDNVAGRSSVDILSTKVEEVGHASQLRAAVEAAGSVRADLNIIGGSRAD